MEDKDLKLKEILDFLGCEKTKFYKDIKLICEAYDIDRGKFKKAGKTKDDYYKDENSFLFKKEWKDIAQVLFTMFDQNPYYNQKVKKSSVTLNEIIRYYNQYIEKIDQLPEIDKKIIKSNKIYNATVAEKENLRLLRNRLELLILFTSQNSPTIRNNIWVSLNKSIDDIILSLIHDSKNALTEINNDFDVKKFLEFYYCTSIDEYLAFYLDNKMDIISNEMIQELFNGESTDLDINEGYFEQLKIEVEQLKTTLQESVKRQSEEYFKNRIQESTGKSFEEILNKKAKVSMKDEEVLFVFQEIGVLVGEICQEEGRELIRKQFILDCFEKCIQSDKGLINSANNIECELPEIVDASNLETTFQKYISENGLKPENEIFVKLTVNYIKDWIETNVIDDTSKSIFDEANYYINNPIS